MSTLPGERWGHLRPSGRKRRKRLRPYSMAFTVVFVRREECCPFLKVDPPSPPAENPDSAVVLDADERSEPEYEEIGPCDRHGTLVRATLCRRLRRRDLALIRSEPAITRGEQRRVYNLLQRQRRA